MNTTEPIIDRRSMVRSVLSTVIAVAFAICLSLGMLLDIAAASSDLRSMQPDVSRASGRLIEMPALIVTARDHRTLAAVSNDLPR